MKKVHLFLVLLLFGACASLLLTYSTITNEFTQIRILGYQYPLAIVSLLVLIVITALSFIAKDKGMKLVTLLLSLSNVFFSFFMFVFLSLYNGSVTTTEIKLGAGIYVNCTISLVVFIVLLVHTVKLLRNK